MICSEKEYLETNKKVKNIGAILLIFKYLINTIISLNFRMRVKYLSKW